MRFENGYPCINGSSDAEDSSHLAGILALVDHPQAVDMRRYVDIGNPNAIKYYRYPGAKNDCSRDQGIMIMCGLLAQGHKELVKAEYINGKDILPPSVHGIQGIAETGKTTWLEREDFDLEIAAKCLTEGSMIGEPFQDMAKAIVYDELKMWTTKNYLWDVAIYRYLYGGDCKWRDEKDLCEFIIKKIQERIK